MHNAHAGEVPFPYIGEGAVLRFRTVDLVRLRGKYGAPANARPEFDAKGNRIDFFWSILITGIEGSDPVIMTDLLRAGLKGPDGKTPLEGVDFDDLPFHLQAVEVELMDAVFLSRWGVTTAEYADRLRKQTEEAAKELGPLMGSETDEMSSTAFSEPLSEQD